MSAPRRIFRRLSLSAKLISSYLVILGVGGVLITVVGSTIVSSTIMAEAERTVQHDLAMARAVYRQELQVLRSSLEVVAAGGTLPTLLSADTGALKTYLNDLRTRQRLDFLAVTDPGGRVIVRSGATRARGDVVDSRVVAAALAGEGAAGTEVFTRAQLVRESSELADRAAIRIEATPRASGGGGGRLDSGLVLVGAAPARDARGRTVGVLYGGRLLNGAFAIVDQVQASLYRGANGEGGAGTVTIFQGDVRVSTNVRTRDGRRALGTRVSDDVRRAVLEEGGRWNDRAFVVDAWYITSYEPIRDPDGTAIGMLYVGLPEAPYVAIRNRVIASFVVIAGLGFLLVLLVTYLGIQRLTRPLRRMARATRSIASGDFGHDVEVEVDPGSEGEVARLAGSFNLMLASLRQMRADLEDWGRTLEVKVEERTEALVEMRDRVAQSQRLASLGMLAAGVAHEVNNPLGGILALTALTLEDLPIDDPNRENLEEVVRQTERCRDIVKGLLEFSRQTEVSADELDLNDVLTRTVNLVARQALFLNIEVERDLDPALPPVFGDRSELQQVFMNILMNAAEAMQAGQGTLTVATRTLPDRRHVEVRFSDTGRGISREHLDRIFDPFFTTGKEGRGTGLGLSIAYGIVTRHQGTITVDSAPGQGTTFAIQLPTAAFRGSIATGERAEVPAGAP